MHVVYAAYTGQGTLNWLDANERMRAPWQIVLIQVCVSVPERLIHYSFQYHFYLIIK